MSDRVERLFADAVMRLTEHEDLPRLTAWLEQRLDAEGMRDIFGIASHDERRSLAHNLGRSLWNATPLPSNGFRPKPLPSLGRNDPCFCGSGVKFKRCCGRMPPPAMETGVVWMLLLPRLSAAVRRAAIESRQAPIGTLIELATEQMENGKPKKALGFLEPLFDAKLHGSGEEHDYALNLLCNIYDDLGFRNKKSALLERVIGGAGRSPLRSGALQRLAAMRLDSGDTAGAWESFRAAQRDDPGSSSLGMLEAQMLIAEGRLDQARERARFWVRRLRSMGWSQDDAPVALLKAVVHDPALAMADVGLDMAAGAGRRLRDWLNDVSRRPVPDYRLSTEPEAPIAAHESLEAALVERLRQMGVPDADIASMVDELQERQGDLDLDEPQEDDDVSPELAPEEAGCLRAPERIVALESRWRDVFPLGKPFSVNPTAFSDEGVWDPDEEARWMAFLEEHPEAFDSLDILDDLTTAVQMHPQAESVGLAPTLQQPLLRRAHAIIERALAESPLERPRLIWMNPENRPALRSLVRLVYLEKDLGKDEEATALAKLVLSLNPKDNHGLRTVVINELLRAGDDAEALALARRYPDDLNPDIGYGAVLALYRLGRREEAQRALKPAACGLPKIPRYLTAARVRKPKIEALGVRLGGDDQAWIYRDEMRDVWAATPGALDWLRKAAKRRG